MNNLEHPSDHAEFNTLIAISKPRKVAPFANGELGKD
jgi:hypothetical protein